MNEILLYGTVGSSFWDEECFTARTVRDALDGMSGPITVRINSGGGIATEGQAIYTALRGYADQVHVVVEGIAASAASLIAMAGDTITMSAGSILMVHDPASPWVEGRGTEEDHLKEAQVLGVIANAYAGIYAKAARITVEEAREIMRAETYFDGPAALEAGFATDVDEDADEVAPAAFDYRIYQHAPARLLSTAGAIKSCRPRAAILAMMAGIGPKPRKGVKSMGTKLKPGRRGRIVATTASQEEDDPTAEEEDDPKLEEQDDPEAETEDDPNAEEDDPEAEDEDDLNAEEDDPEAEEEDEPRASAPTEAVAIYRMCARAGLSFARAEDFIARGLTCVQAVAELNGKGSKVKTRNHAPRARILRDERDTRRRGMSEAIVAQLQGKPDLAGPGRAYMGMSLIEMVASTTGHRGPLRSAGQRVQVLMDASHSVSDFPAIFENALNKHLLERYQIATPTYRAIARKKNFKDFRPMPLVRAGDFPMLKPISETGEIKWGTFGESREAAMIESYAIGITISRQMIINDDLGAIDEVLSTYGERIALFEEITFYAAALSAVMSDGKPVFHADHGNRAAAGSAIDVASVSAGRAAMIKQKTIDGSPIMGNEPTILLVGADKLTEAEQFLHDITATRTEDVNVFTGNRLKPLMTTQIAGNAWALLSERNPNWIYGYLEGMEAPRLRTEEPFGTQGFSMTLEHDFGVGAADYRGGYWNPGA